MTNNGAIWWNELQTTDEEGAIRFYTQLIGWRTFQLSDLDSLKPAQQAQPVYTVWMKGWSQAGGMMKLNGEPGGQSRPAWLPFIAVENVDVCAERAVELGGAVLREPFDVENSGRFAILRDPQGAVFGIGKPASAEV